MKPVTVLLVVMNVAGGYDLQSAGVCKARKGAVTISIPANGVPLQLDEKVVGSETVWHRSANRHAAENPRCESTVAKTPVQEPDNTISPS